MRAPVFALLVLLTACAPGRYDPPALEPTGSAIDGLFSASVDDTRRAVTGVLHERRIGVLVEVDDPARGVVTSAFAPVPSDLDELACTGFAVRDGESVDGIRYRLRVEIRRRGRALTRLRVYADVQGYVRAGAAPGAWTDCTSTGELERDFLDAVESALRGE